jgi:hypothetical protein
MALMTIDTVIKELLLEQGDTQMNKYLPYLQRAISGLRELEMDVSGSPTVVELPIDPNTDTANLPGDYLQYVRIGLCGTDGNIHSLGLNAKMCLPRSTNACGTPTTELQTNVAGGWWASGSWDGYADNFRNGEVMGRMFGIGGGLNPNGYYRIDKERGTINLSSLPENTGHVVIEYLSTLKMVDEKYHVHPFVVDALKNWISWKSIAYNPHRGLGERDMARRDYYTARTAAKRRFNTATFDEWFAALRHGNTLAPRF